MQSKTFGRLSIFVVVIASICVLLWISRQATETNPFPQESLIASSTELFGTSTVPVSDAERQIIELKLPRGTIHAIVASSSAEVELGLGGRTSLARDTGMLFFFPVAGKYGFWMKGMNFPIDVVWMNASSTVTAVLPNLSPDTYPNVYYPEKDVKYVLELNAGAAAEYGITPGNKLVF